MTEQHTESDMRKQRRTLRWWRRRRPLRLSVWWLANEKRWADMRLTLLAERGLTEDEANDVRVP